MTFTPNTLEASQSNLIHIIIIGGGLAGLATALGLRNTGHAVTVLERVAEFSKISAGLHIPPNATNALKSLDVFASVNDYSIQPHEICIRSYRSGAVLRDLNLVPDMQNIYNAPYFTAHRATFHNTLLDKAIAEGVRIEHGCLVNKIDFPEASVHLENGDVYKGDLILGTDGENSQCRELMLARPDPPYHNGDMIFGLDIKQADIRKYEDLRDIVDPPKVTFWFGPGTHCVGFSLKENDLFHIIGGLPDAATNKIQARPQPVNIQELRDYHKDWDPRLRKLLNLADFSLKWTSTAMNELRTWTHPSEKFALVGDAAHAMTPFLGQGAAQCIEDAATLSTLFAHLSHKSQIPELLTVYESLRKPRALELQRRSLSMRTVYGMYDGDEQMMRDRQLTLCEPFEGYVVPWMDPEFQKWMYTYDAAAEAEKAWQKSRCHDG